jgi:SAM-dependent methyltransferase
LRILDVGCGQAKTPGAVGLDLLPAAAADLLADAGQRAWPFADNTFDRIIGRHVIEHVPDVMAFMAEAHRVGRAGASLQIVTPHFSNRYSYTDPTHLRHLAWRSFDYFTGASAAPRPTFLERALELRHPIPAFYTGVRFRPRRTTLSFGRPYRLLGIAALANRWPDLYEQYLAFTWPARDLTFELEVVK